MWRSGDAGVFAEVRIDHLALPPLTSSLKGRYQPFLAIVLKAIRIAGRVCLAATPEATVVYAYGHQPHIIGISRKAPFPSDWTYSLTSDSVLGIFAVAAVHPDVQSWMHSFGTHPKPRAQVNLLRMIDASMCSEPR